VLPFHTHHATEASARANSSKNLDSRHRDEIEPTIGLGQEDAKKPGAGQFSRDILRRPTSGLDTVALRHDAGPERAGNRIKAWYRLRCRASTSPSEFD
jgi:hypothetical protein